MTATIKDVELVKGKTLSYGWRSDMQVITTDNGTYIDNKPGGGRGDFWKAPDYKELIGEKVEFDVLNDDLATSPLLSDGRNWMKLIK